MAKNDPDSVLISLKELKAIEVERTTQKVEAERARIEAEHRALEAEERRRREEEEAHQRAEEEKLRLEQERQAAIQREEQIKREGEARRAAVAAEEARRRAIVAEQAAAEAKAKARHLRRLVGISVVVSILVLSGIGYLVRHFYETKKSATIKVAEIQRRYKVLAAQLAELNKGLEDDMRRNAALIDKLKAKVDAAPEAARRELTMRLRQAEERKRQMEAQRKRTQQRFRGTKDGISDRL